MLWSIQLPKLSKLSMRPQDPEITNSQCKVISTKIAPLSKEFISFFVCIPLIMLHTILSNSPDTQIGQSHLAGICWPPCHGWKGSCMTNIDIPSFKKPFLIFQLTFFWLAWCQTQVAISVRAVQGVFHRKKSFASNFAH